MFDPNDANISVSLQDQQVSSRLAPPFAPVYAYAWPRGVQAARHTLSFHFERLLRNYVPGRCTVLLPEGQDRLSAAEFGSRCRLLGERSGVCSDIAAALARIVADEPLAARTVTTSGREFLAEDWVAPLADGDTTIYYTVASTNGIVTARSVVRTEGPRSTWALLLSPGGGLVAAARREARVAPTGSPGLLLQVDTFYDAELSQVGEQSETELGSRELLERAARVATGLSSAAGPDGGAFGATRRRGAGRGRGRGDAFRKRH